MTSIGVWSNQTSITKCIVFWMKNLRTATKVPSHDRQLEGPTTTDALEEHTVRVRTGFFVIFKNGRHL